MKTVVSYALIVRAVYFAFIGKRNEGEHATVKETSS